MIGLDTNMLVRYLVRDDPDQSEQAQTAFARFTPDCPGYVSLVTLLETVWLLRRTYKVPSDDILGTVTALVASDAIRLQEEPTVTQAISLARQHACDLPDALVAVFGAACSETLTFDRHAAQLPGMTLIPPESNRPTP